jgi:membrane protease YdiL (CAAX protease family)
MLSEKPWRIEDVVRLFLAIIATLCIGIMLGTAVISQVDHYLIKHTQVGLTDDQRNFAGMVVMAVFLQVSALFWIGHFLRRFNLSWRQAFGFEPAGAGRSVGFGVSLGLMVLPLAWGLQMLSAQVMDWVGLNPQLQPVVEALQKPGVALYEQMFLGVLAIGIAPLVEEAMFRGILYSTIRQSGYPRLALWGTSVLFGLSHFSMVTFVPLTIFAVLLALLYERTGNLLAPMAAHSVFNAANFIYLIFEPQIDRVLHIQ